MENKLTKDDFEIGEYGMESAVLGIRFTDIKFSELRDQILKNQEDSEFLQNLIKEYEDGLSIELIKQWKEDAEKYNKHWCQTVSDYPELKAVVERLKKRKKFYVDDLHECNKKGLYGTSVHYDSIIEELNLLLGHEHDWKYFKHIKYCKPCGIYKTMSDKELQRILGDK